MKQKMRLRGNKFRSVLDFDKKKNIFKSSQNVLKNQYKNHLDLDIVVFLFINNV